MYLKRTRSLLLAILAATAMATTAKAADYTINGTACQLLDPSSHPAGVAPWVGIRTDTGSGISCSLPRLTRSDNQLSRVEIDYYSGVGATGQQCVVVALSDTASAVWGTHKTMTTAANQYTWLVWSGGTGLPVAPNSFSSYGAYCNMPVDGGITGVVVTE